MRTTSKKSAKGTTPDEEKYPLGKLGQSILRHWKEHRPRMCRELERQGKLREAVYNAEELTLDAMDDLMYKKRLSYDQAWELVREEWAFLPPER